MADSAKAWVASRSVEQAVSTFAILTNLTDISGLAVMQRHTVRPRHQASIQIKRPLKEGVCHDLPAEVGAAFLRAKCAADATAEADFVALLAQQPLLIRAAQSAMLHHLRNNGAGSNLLRCAEAEALACVLGAAHARLKDLLNWQPRRGAFGTWWGLQAFYHYNNTQRRHDERTCGMWRSTGDTLRLECDWQPNDQGELQPLALPDLEADPAEHYANLPPTWSDLLAHVQAADQPHLQRLREWLAADALQDTPLSLSEGSLRLNWRHGAQAAQAEASGVTTRTLRNHTKGVEAMLARLADRIANKAK